MTSAWVAGTTRSHALAARRLGRDGARDLARSGSLERAVTVLAAGPYGHDVRPGMALPAARHAVGVTLLWNLRVLAGWLPRDGVAALRALAGWFELADVDRALLRAAGADGGTGYRLGALRTAGPRVTQATTRAELRTGLARSGWGDPGGESAAEIQLGLRLSWAERVARQAPPAAGWAGAGTALLVAREVVLARRPLPARLRARVGRLLGPAAATVTDVTALRAALPRSIRWALDGVDRPGDLWRGELRFWARVEDDGHRLAAAPGFGLGPVIGTVALLATDARRVRAALALAAAGTAPEEVLDAVV